MTDNHGQKARTHSAGNSGICGRIAAADPNPPRISRPLGVRLRRRWRSAIDADTCTTANLAAGGRPAAGAAAAESQLTPSALAAVLFELSLGTADAEAVSFHIGNDSRETSINEQERRMQQQHEVNTAVSSGVAARPPRELESQASLSHPMIQGPSSRAGGVIPAGGVAASAPGFQNDEIYGSDYNRAKVQGGPAGGYYDDKEHKFHEELPKTSFGERMTAGLIRPTNLTSGERPHMGRSSDGTDDFEHTSYEKVAATPTNSQWWHWASLPAAFYPWNVNANAYRLGMIPVIALCILGTDKRHHRWMYYVTLGLAVDYLCRMIAGPRASLCTLFGDFCDAFFHCCRSRKAPKGLFPVSMVAGAPYQFSDLCGFLLLAAATICFFAGDHGRSDDDNDTAGAVLLAVMALIAFLELVFGFPLWVWTFNQLVHFGWVWKDSQIKSAMIRDEMARLETSEELRSQVALAQLRDEKFAAQRPQHMHFSGNGKRSLPYSYRTANEYHKRHDFNPLKHIKTSYFLASATLAALAWCWVVASRPDVWSTPNIVWYILIIAALVVFAVHLILYLIKLAVHPHHVMYEWEHPIHRSHFLALPLAWLLFIPSIIAAGYSDLAEVVFWIGAPILLALSIYQMSLWWHQNHFFDSFGAGWLMIPMANAIAASFLPMVHSSYAEAAWLWLGISVFTWIILCTLLVFKGSFQPRQHDAHRYGLWMMMGTAFAITFALVAIYSQAQYVGPPATQDVQTVQASATPTSNLAIGNNYNVLIDDTNTDPTVYLPTLGAAPTGRLGLFSHGLGRAYAVRPVNGLINGVPLLLVNPNQGGLECADNSVALGWSCSYRAQYGRTFATADWPLLAVAAFYIGLVLTLVLLLLTVFGYFGRRAWSVRWWIVPLCLCMLSLACLYYHQSWQSDTTLGIAITAMVLTNIAAGLMLMNHLRALLFGELYRPDDLKMSPLEFFRLPNKAMREVLFVMQSHVNNPKASVDDWAHFETVLMPRYLMTLSAINYVKRGTLFPVMRAWFGKQVYMPLDQNALALEDALDRILDSMKATQAMAINSDQRLLAEKKDRADFATYVSGATANFDEEDIHLYALARRYVGGKEAQGMVRKSWEEVSPSRWSVIIPFVVEFLRSDDLRARWLETMAHASPEHIHLIGKYLYENVDPFLYERLCVDLPEMRPRMTAGYSRVW